METLERKKTIGQFSLDLLFECLEGSAKDVVLYCSDGQITFNRFYLSIISPVLFDILNNCLYNSLPEISVILPEFSRHEVKKLKKLCVDGYINKSSLSEALSILKPGDTPSLSSPLSKKTVGRPLPDYYETIPDISNLDALDLFDPMYVEDVEIENEDNLSLTIHSNDVELMMPKKSKAKRPKPSPKPKSRKKVDRAESSVDPAGAQRLVLKISKSCLNCSQTFENNVLLEKHSGDCSQRFSCTNCNKSFKTQALLTAHESKHSAVGDRKLICQFCTKAFKKIFQLHNHLRIHSGERPFICHTCGKAFNQEATLRTHLRIHSGLKPHVCGDCGETFITGNSLLSHKQWKHADGSRPYPCQVCAKSFPTKGAVKKHESIHKTERTHPCQLCDKKFARADHLKSHMRSHQNSTANSIV